jgi:outer membrane protein OmpA-like peptidoglycan-associated protein
MSTSDDDSQQRFALGFLFALIALVISVVVGTVVVKHMGAATSAKAPATALANAAPAAAPLAGAEDATVRVENGVVKFYFATGKAELAGGAGEVLADVVKGVAEGKKAVVSGFHDATGDAAQNAELAKQRALVVRDALKGLGVAEDRIELKKPEVTTASGSDAEARRVEVALAAL